MADGEKDENYQKEYKIFMTKLFKFHEQNGTPIKRLPLLGGKELDLYHLYQKVQSLGGSEQVTRNRQWGEVARSFNLPPSVTSASYAIRQHFVKLLERYEQLENDIVYGPASTAAPALFQLGSAATFHAPLPTASLTSITACVPTPVVDTALLKYDRLIRSLSCGFPNEVDFTFNVLTLLSHEGTLPIEKLPHLLDLMLAHVGIFSQDDSELEDLHYGVWYKDLDIDFAQFWGEAVPSWVLDAVFPALIIQGTGSRFASISHDMPEAYRITQLMNIIYNLCFDLSSVLAISSHNGIRSVVLLGVNTVIPSIQTLALDTFVNMSSHLVLTSSEYVDVDGLLLESVHRSVLSSDRHSVIRGLEVLSGLAWCLENEAALLATPTEVYRHMFDLLLVPDCQIMIASLEALYTLSMYGVEVAEGIASVSGCVNMMVSMATLEVKEEILQHIKIVSTQENVESRSSESSPSNSSHPLVAMTTTPPVSTTTTTAQSTGNSLLLALLPKQGLSAETFTRQWLQTCYEAAPGECVQQMELYASYLIYCTQVGQNSILSSNDFTALVKKMFPNSLSARVTIGTHAVHVVAGLRKRRLSVVPPRTASSPAPVSSTALTFSTRPLQLQATVKNAVHSPLMLASKAGGTVSSNHVSTLIGHNQTAASPNHVNALKGFSVEKPVLSTQSMNGAVRVECEEINKREGCRLSETSASDMIGNNEPVSKRVKLTEQDLEAFITCHWDNCNFSHSIKRSRLSLVTHLKLHHCSSCQSCNHSNLPSVSQTLAKLKYLPPLEVKEESPATKAVRLTAALVLRNLAKFIPSVRRELQLHELWLSEVALSESEASTALAQCLSFLSS